MLTDIIWTHFPQIEMFSIDTGRLPEETYELLERLQRRYERRLRLVYPDARALETPRRAPGRQRLLRQPRGAPGMLPRAQGRALPPRDRRLPSLGDRRAP